MNKFIALNSNYTITSSTSVLQIQKLLLENRKIIDPVNFLSPPVPTPDPIYFDINQEIFYNFINHLKNNLGKHVLIYGDYDADGVTSTALLYLSLSKHFKNILPFTPHREEDGYGIKAASVLKFCQKKSFSPDIVLTIDNGISAKKEIAILQEKSIEVMVIDHHVSGQTTPDARHILHSTVTSASGLAWLVASQFDHETPIELAAIGIISDCLPLVGINRQVVVHGLSRLNTTKNIGLNSLISASGLSEKKITSYDIAFSLAPRLNATGRLEDPTDALRLLCAPSLALANKYSSRLGELNTDRQMVQKESLDLVEPSLDTTKKLLIFYDQSLHPGVIGLIAGKLTEKYYKPSIIITKVNGVCKGSCRSIPELHIAHCLEDVRHLCIDLGGHAMAAGFSIEEKNIDIFIKEIGHIVESKLVNIKLVPKIDVDAKMDTTAVRLECITAIEKLSPFGIENPEPLFLFENIFVKSINVLGKEGTHLKLVTENNLECLIFKAKQSDFSIKIGDKVSFVAKLGANTWNNITRPQVLVKEIL